MTVNRIITDKDAATRAQYPEIVPMLDLAQTLSQQLIAMRKKRGEIDFDIKEAKVIVNEEGIPKEVVTRERVKVNV
nr:RNB domain-containing ribonuclease [Staphylococcus pseudintermedius]